MFQSICMIGFFSGCRPTIFLDGTFLKHNYRGCLLSAKEKDADGGLLLIAFAVVSAKKKKRIGNGFLCNWYMLCHSSMVEIGIDMYFSPIIIVDFCKPYHYVFLELIILTVFKTLLTISRIRLTFKILSLNSLPFCLQMFS
ncbi:hypothetical protein Droror1_Dr00017671 [Drosera rotundifolia]